MLHVKMYNFVLVSSSIKMVVYVQREMGIKTVSHQNISYAKVICKSKNESKMKPEKNT